MTRAECEKRLVWMRLLRRGWDSYDADPPTPGARRAALAFCRAACSLDRPPDRVNPSVAGGVGVTFAAGPRQAYVEFANRGAAILACYGHGGEPEVSMVSSEPGGFSETVGRIESHLA